MSAKAASATLELSATVFRACCIAFSSILVETNWLFNCLNRSKLPGSCVSDSLDCKPCLLTSKSSIALNNCLGSEIPPVCISKLCVSCLLTSEAVNILPKAWSNWIALLVKTSKLLWRYSFFPVNNSITLLLRLVYFSNAPRYKDWTAITVFIAPFKESIVPANPATLSLTSELSKLTLSLPFVLNSSIPAVICCTSVFAISEGKFKSLTISITLDLTFPAISSGLASGFSWIAVFILDIILPSNSVDPIAKLEIKSDWLPNNGFIDLITLFTVPLP